MSILQGLIVLAVVLSVYLLALYFGRGDAAARTLSFTTLIIANLGLILTNRSWSLPIYQSIRTPNSALWWVVGGALIFLGLVLYFPPMRELFQFTTLNPTDLILCFLVGFSSILWFEGLKMIKKF